MNDGRTKIERDFRKMNLSKYELLNYNFLMKIIFSKIPMIIDI